MPAEYILGAAVAVILLVLLASFLLGNRTKRKIVHMGGGADEQTVQLARIADALQEIVVHLRALPPQAAPPPAPSEKPLEQKVSEARPSETGPTEAAGTDQAEGDEPKKHHYVRLSMFGR
jgi:hypothetical protein